MFRVKEAAVERKFSLTGRAIEAALLTALLANFASAILIVREYRVLSSSVAQAEPLSPHDLDSLRRDVLLQLATGCVVLFTFAFALAATWWMRRRYSSSERSLRQVKMLAHDILASTDRGVVTTDRDGTVTSVNPAALRLLEAEIGCVGAPLEKLGPRGIPFGEIVRTVGEQGTKWSGEVVLTRGGQRLRLRIDGNVLSDTAGTPTGCVVHLEDTTEQLLMEERMRRMERYLGLSSLASGLHHEIKNPLTALSLHIQLLEEGLARPNGAGDVGELVEVLKTEVCRLNGVLESFRSFAHLQRLVLRPTDALGVVEEVIRLVRPQAAQQQVRITLLHPGTELPRVPLDPDKFEQAVLNLVINALEAMPAGGTLTVSATAEGGEFRLAVADSGPGIPPEVQPSVFQPYFSTKDRGTGMGLALSEKLVGQHGGRIDFQTGPAGTTFRIAVPLSQPDGEPHE